MPSRRNILGTFLGLSLATFSVFADAGGPVPGCAYLQDFDTETAPIYDSILYFSLGFDVNGQHITNSNFILTDASGSGKFLYHNTAPSSEVTEGEAWGTPGSAGPVVVLPDRLYRLSFKMANNNGTNPQLIEVQINGAILATNVTSSLIRVWESYSFDWNSGAATSADISLLQTRPYVSGIDWGFDEISLCPVRPDIEVIKDDGEINYTPGGTGTYTITVRNNADTTIADQSVEGVSVSDTLPDGVTLSSAWLCTVSDAGTGAISTACGATSGGGAGASSIDLTVDLAEGAEVTISVPVQYSADDSDY